MAFLYSLDTECACAALCSVSHTPSYTGRGISSFGSDHYNDSAGQKVYSADFVYQRTQQVHEGPFRGVQMLRDTARMIGVHDKAAFEFDRRIRGIIPLRSSGMSSDFGQAFARVMT